MKIRRIRKKSKKTFCKTFFHEKTFFSEKSFFFPLFFHRSNLRFSAEDIFLRPRPTRRMRGGTADMAHQSTGYTQRSRNARTRVFARISCPAMKKMLFVKFLFLRADLGKRIFAPRCAGRRTWGNPRGYSRVLGEYLPARCAGRRTWTHQ